MAIVKKSDLQGKVEVKLNSDVQLPRNRYVLRCVKEEAVIAKSSGNYQYVREWEIVQPETIDLPTGETVRVAGTKMTQYLGIKCYEDKDGVSAAQRTANAQDRLFKENAKIGLAQEVDDENAALECAGIIADAICGSEEYVQRMEPTAEQRSKGAMGSPIKGADGKEIKKYTPRLIEILGKGNVSSI